MKPTNLLTPQQTANYLGIKLPTLYSWVFQRKIPFKKVGRLLRFDHKELEEWLETCSHKVSGE